MPHILKHIALLAALLAAAMAQGQYTVRHLEKPYNTPGSETGAIRVGDTILAYSSMQPTHGKRNRQFGFQADQMIIYQARIARNGKIARPRPSRWGINSKRDHTGNLAIDPLTHDIYFTRCPLDNADLQCDIWWARRQKRRWDKPQRLRGNVNLKEHTATQPSIGHLADGTTILYFSSDRPGGMGGMDIWYSIVRDGTAEEPVNLGPQVNSASDEITPFYDQRNGVLYFSSDRQGGKGGYDIYCSAGSRNTWQAAELVCGCLNSEQNDIYFTITKYDSACSFPLGGYLSSNRNDSYYLQDSMCCNDIYEWGLDSTVMIVREEPEDSARRDTTPPVAQQPKATFHFPLYLFFHNDDPDPRSHDSTTATTYADCQHRYAALRDQYMARQKTAIDSAMMQLFFDSCVEGNYHQLEALFDYIEEQLDEGQSAVLTVSGYASPLHTDEYNRILSARRIASFVNTLEAWRDGIFGSALESGQLRVVQNANGIDRTAALSADSRKPADPVYSLQAATARRIEVLSCEVK